MNFLLVVVLVILFINKIKILKKEHKEKEQKLWPIYFSSLVAEATSLLGVYIIQAELVGIPFSAFIVFGMICLICVIENVIFLIVGIVYFMKQKKNIKEKKIKSRNHTLEKIFLTFLIIYGGMFLIAYMPKMFKTEMEKYIEGYVTKYMTTKYGDGDFKVINIAKDYTGGFFGELEEQSGYYVKMKTSYTDGIIGMFIDGTTKETIEISYDSLILDYHRVDDFFDFQNNLMDKKIKILDDGYKKYFDVDIDFDCYYKVPDDYGHIPSIDELVELCSIDTEHINIKVNDYVEKKNELDYLKRLAKYSMNYFNAEEEVNIYYTLNYRNGFIKINYSTITIKLDDEEKIYSKEDIQNYTN